MREKYGASPGAQQLKYHMQTSGRSLHAQEMDFNDIRTTLQALCAIYDNCNSLHTNAYDEAVTTPSTHSVRRALAIQMIIDKEWGLAGNENPLQGSFVLDQLADLVEEAVLAEFDRISERGGILGECVHQMGEWLHRGQDRAGEVADLEQQRAWAMGWICGSPCSAMARRAAWRWDEQPAAPCRRAARPGARRIPGGLTGWV